MTYAIWLFDCDGVILDSNAVKTDSFRTAALPYGSEAAETLVRHHIANGGISRYRKFEYFFETILGRTDFEADYRRALEAYAAQAKRGMLECAEIPGVRKFLEETRQGGPDLMAVVSGSDETELRDVLAERGFARYFDDIRGSPAAKNDIIGDLLKRTGPAPAVLFGDSRVDLTAAAKFGIDFVMIYGYSDWRSWREEVGRIAASAVDFASLKLP